MKIPRGPQRRSLSAPSIRILIGHQLSYRDNDDHGEISLQQVKQVEPVTGNVKLTLLDGQDRMINTSQMNFRGRDLLELVGAIKECLPASDPAPN